MKKQIAIVVQKEKLEESYRCNQDYLCKSKNWKTCSKMDETVIDMIIHIDEPYNEQRMMLCNYHLNFGGDNYCTCLARMYIYKKYGV